MGIHRFKISTVAKPVKLESWKLEISPLERSFKILSWRHKLTLILK